MTRRKRSFRSPPHKKVAYYFNFINIILFGLCVVLLFLLIQERVYLEQGKYLSKKYHLELNRFLNSSYQLLQNPARPKEHNSSTNFIYLSPEEISFVRNFHF